MPDQVRHDGVFEVVGAASCRELPFRNAPIAAEGRFHLKHGVWFYYALKNLFLRAMSAIIGFAIENACKQIRSTNIEIRNNIE